MGVRRPAFRGSSRKEGGVYHILAPQGQTQFLRGENAEQAGRGGRGPRCGQQFPAAVLGAIGRLDQPRGLAATDGGQDLLEPGDKIAAPACKAQTVEKPLRQHRLDRVGEGRRRDQFGLRGAGKEALLGGGVDACAVGGDPDAPTRQLARQVGRDHAVRSGDEPDQLVFLHHRARDDVPALSRGLPVGPRDTGRRGAHVEFALTRKTPLGVFRLPFSHGQVVVLGVLDAGFGLVALNELFLDVFRLRRGLDPAHDDPGAHDQRLGVVRRQVEGFQDARLAHALAILGFEPATQVVRDQAGEILDGLHLALAQGDGDRQVDAFDLEHGVLDAQLDATGVLGGGFLVEEFAGASLQFLGGILVEAFDGRDFMRLDVGDVFDRHETFGGQQLGDDLVDVQGFLEEGRGLGELLLTALALLRLRHDVDLPAGQLRGEADVLAAAADGQRQLLVRHHHFDALVFLVHDDLGDFGGSQGVDDEGRLVRVPLDDVDLLALQLGDDSLNAAAAHTDAGADGVDAAVVGDHGHLGARTGVTGDGADLDDAVVDFRHFLREQLGHEAAVGAAEHDLRALGLATDVVDVAADAVADVEVLTRDRLVAAHDAFAAAQVDDDVAVLDALDRAVDDLADAILELFELTLALGFADLAGHDLASHLGLDAAELERRQLLVGHLADEGVAVGGESVGEADLSERLFVQLGVVGDHGHVALDRGFAGLRIDRDPDVVFLAVAAARGLLDRFLDGGDHDFLLDALFAGDRVGDLEKLEPVGGNAGGHGRCPYCLARSLGRCRGGRRVLPPRVSSVDR